MTGLALQEDILKLQTAIASMPQYEHEPMHVFTAGLYSRTIFLPAGSVIVGAIHKTEHQYVVSCGQCISVVHDSRENITAPHIGITKPGDKRVIRAITDTVWTTFHATDLTDPDKIAKEITEQEHVCRT